MAFDIIKANQEYPEIGGQMIEPMKIWKLPSGKEDKLSEVCSSGEYFLEEKIDGAFYQFVKTENYEYLFGRTVSIKNGLLTEKGANVPHILSALSCLPKDTILIGEIYYPGCTSKDVVSIMGCLPELAVKRQENNPIHYYLHDIIEYNGINLINLGAEDRYKILVGVWNKHNLSQYDFLRLAQKVDENLEEEISRILKSGGEGVVLKKKDYPYAPGKRPAWSTVKVKQMDSIDLICMGFCPPTKEYTGKELDTWEYWVIEKQNENGIWVEQEKVCPYKAIRSPEYRTLPISRYYFYGWNTAIKVGAYNNLGELIELGTVSSGLTDDMKRDMTENPQNYLNKVVSLDCMSIDKKEHTLRHPVLKSWRADKDARDCIIDEIFQ